MTGLVVIGASYAGLQAAVSAREAGYAEPIRIVTDESHLPYQRPPLSKGFLVGNVDERGLMLRSEEFFAAQGIELALGRRATRVDRRACAVELEGGGRIAYDKLLIATGSRARLLTVPGGALPGIYYLRSLDDARNLTRRLAGATAVIIIGGGFIGLEVASSAAKLGKSVTVIEAASRLLERAVSPLVSQFLLDLHRAHGVDIRLNETVLRIDGDDGGMHEVVCERGRRIRGDLIVAGIGGVPNDELASGADIQCANGIAVDEFGQTGDACILAAGDCSNHPNRFAGRRLRLESVQNATDQGKSAGATIAGKRDAYASVPRFWSDQCQKKLQIVGVSTGHDLQVVRDRAEDGRFSVFYYRRSRLIAVESVNRPGDQIIARRLIAGSISPSPEQAADLSFDFKTLEAAGRPGERG